jgi:hypothetical protein
VPKTVVCHYPPFFPLKGYLRGTGWPPKRREIHFLSDPCAVVAERRLVALEEHLGCSAGTHARQSPLRALKDRKAKLVDEVDDAPLGDLLHGGMGTQRVLTGHSRGTRRALEVYSRGTRGVLEGDSRDTRGALEEVIRRQSRGSQGSLKGYSRGKQGVLKGYLRATPGADVGSVDIAAFKLLLLLEDDLEDRVRAHCSMMILGLSGKPLKPD